MRHAPTSILLSCTSECRRRLCQSRRCTSIVQQLGYCFDRPQKLRQLSFTVMSQSLVNRSSYDPNLDTPPGSQGGAGSSERQKGHRGPSKKRDTHFLCFPLVTNTSVAQLAASLQHFREVATKPHREKTRTQQGGNNAGSEQSTSSEPVQDFIGITEADADTLHPNANLSQPLPFVNADLQILPAVAHRPPGTFHLTLGVMDLSSEERMSQALELLQTLDYAEILQAVLLQWAEMQPSHKTGKDGGRLAQAEKHSGSQNDAAEAVASLKRPVSPPPIAAKDRLSTPFSKDHPPHISLTGLSTFPSPKASRVFYARPSPPPSSPFPLLQFGQAIRRKFREAGFITETRPLVLHATLANMRYAVQAKGGRTSKGKAWRFGKDRWTDGEVDARDLIKCFDQYGGDVEEHRKGAVQDEGSTNEFLWAKDIELNRVAICKMGAEKSEDEVLGQVYPPIGEKLIFS